MELTLAFRVVGMAVGCETRFQTGRTLIWGAIEGRHMQTMAPADGETVEVVDGVYLTQLVAGQRTSIQHFHIDPGAVVPAHQHHHEQAGYVDAGTATFVLDDEELVLSAGESYVIPGHETHSVENRGDDPFTGVDIFAPPRTDPDWA